MSTITNMQNMPGGLAAAGFTMPDMSEYYRLFVSTSGLDKSGKTHWALGGPGDVAVLAVDPGTPEIVRQTAKRGKRVFPVFLSPTSTQDGAGKEWEKVERVFSAVVAERAVRTFVVDTMSDLWNLARLKEFGKLEQVPPLRYVGLNRWFEQLVTDVARKRPDLNVVYIHRLGKEYKKEGGKDSWSGGYETKGFSQMPFVVDMNVSHYYRPPSLQAGQPGAFGLQVFGPSRVNAGVAGLVLEGELCTFQMLATMCFPAVPAEMWV